MIDSPVSRFRGAPPPAPGADGSNGSGEAGPSPLVMLEPHRPRPGARAASRLHVETCYRGVPVYSAAVLVGARGREATLHVSRCVANALMRTGAATVCADAWDSPLNGHVSRVDLERLHVTLDGLTRGILPASLRSDARVALDETIAVRLSRGSREFTGRLIDVSVRAVAAYYGNADLGDLAPGQAITVEMVLPGANPGQGLELASPARVLRVDRVTGTDRTGWRVVAVIECDETDYQRLTDYVSAHQQSVLTELSATRPPAAAARSPG